MWPDLSKVKVAASETTYPKFPSAFSRKSATRLSPLIHFQRVRSFVGVLWLRIPDCKDRNEPIEYDAGV